MNNVNEESRYTVTVKPLNESGVAFTPTTVRYRVDDLDTSTELVAWTSLTPATSMTIEIPATAHSMIDASKTAEEKVLTIQTDFDTVDQHSEEHRYMLRNLAFAQVPT